MNETSGTTAAAESTSNDCRATHDWDADGHVAVTIAETLAACSGVSADELPPLYDVVDTDALDAILRPREGERRPTRPSIETSRPHVDCGGVNRVSFVVTELDCSVTIRADGRIEVAGRS